MGADQQLRHLRAFAAKHDLTVIGEYVDRGVSGNTRLQVRPEWHRLLDDAQLGGFSQLLLASADRLGRNGELLKDAQSQLEAAGVRISVAERSSIGIAVKAGLLA